MSRYDQLLSRLSATYGSGALDLSDLDPRFVEHYNNGARLAVVYGAWDDTARIEYGTVGCTTGWKPAWLLMHNTRSLGSSVLLGPEYQIIKVKPVGARKYDQL